MRTLKFLLFAIAAALVVPAIADSTMALTTEDYPPFNVKGDADHPISGISTEIIREMMKRAGIEINITMYPWQRAQRIAMSDSDTCVYSTVRNAKREDLYKWVGPVTSDDWALFALNDTKITLKTLEDARKYKLGGYQGDAAGDFMITHKFNVDIVESDKLNPRKLVAGRIDLWIAGVHSGVFVARREGVMNVKPIFTFGDAKDYQLYLACNKNVADATITRFNDILKQMKSDGSVAKILAKY